MTTGLPIPNIKKDNFRINLLAEMFGINPAKASTHSLPFNVRLNATVLDASGAYLSRGIEKVKEKEYVPAMIMLNDAIAFNPNLVEAYIVRAWAKQKLAMHQGALKDFNFALLANPENANALFGVGVVHYQLEHYAESIAAMKAALQFNAHLSDAYMFICFASVKLNHFQEAIHYFDFQSDLKPFISGSYFARGLLKYKNREVHSAVADFNKAKELGFEFSADLLDCVA